MPPAEHKPTRDSLRALQRRVMALEEYLSRDDEPFIAPIPTGAAQQATVAQMLTEGRGAAPKETKTTDMALYKRGVDGDAYTAAPLSLNPNDLRLIAPTFGHCYSFFRRHDSHGAARDSGPSLSLRTSRFPVPLRDSLRHSFGSLLERIAFNVSVTCRIPKPEVPIISQMSKHTYLSRRA